MRWILWPFGAIWRLVTSIVGLVGRIVAIALGALLIIVGLILSVTIVGAVVGIPLILFGALLVVRSFY